MTGYSPFLACYGGGHAQMIGAVAKGMARRGLSPTVLGFTTAYGALQKIGIEALSVEAVVEDDDEPFLEAMVPFLESENHPEITRRQSRAYFGLGFRDLVTRHGWTNGLAMVEEMGRKAFEPTSVMARFLARIDPDIVVTTTSPRFELATLKAANALKIPSLAIGDLFLVKEADWILGSDYARYICVLNEIVADRLKDGGFQPENIRITGNPAFDALAPNETDEERRLTVRHQLGLDGKTVILWPAPGSSVSMIGRPFIDPGNVVTVLEDFCLSDPSFAYVFRAHPNHPYSIDRRLSGGFIDNGSLTAEEALLVADVVCVEASTMGLQAALRGLPVICIGYSDYVVYPEFGLAQGVDTLEQAIAILRTRDFKPPLEISLPPLGSATENVLQFVEDILSGTA